MLLRGLVLTALVVDVGLVALRVLTYPGVFDIPSFRGTIGFLALSFVAATIFVIGSIRSNFVSGRLSWATATGAASGVILVGHMALENFGARVGQDWRLTVGVMLATFTLWFSSGWWTARGKSTVVTGATAGCWTATVSIVLALTFGLTGMYFDVPPSSYVATWPEYFQSGASDPQAFAIANTLDAATTHMATALILGPILGGAGWFFASLRKGTPRLAR